MKDFEKNIQYAPSKHEREQAVQKKKYDNLERAQKGLIKNLELDNAKFHEQNKEFSEALSKGENGIKEEMEKQKIKFYEADRNYFDLQTQSSDEEIKQLHQVVNNSLSCPWNDISGNWG